uniref:non-specific serine/threonine protein kinase n=1 Tax=Vitis vinifera TaxID=29760 RepID=F6HME0_VITVI
MTARKAPLSLTYFGFCLKNGDYNVRLHFAEIEFKDEEAYSKLGRRIFNIYIQGKLVWEDFNIMEEANGIGKEVIKQSNVTVTNNTLEIRLYWAGKGTTCIPKRGRYGPLISAISICPSKLNIHEPLLSKLVQLLQLIIVCSFFMFNFPYKKVTIVGVATSVSCLILFVLGVLCWKYYFGGKNMMEKELRGLDLQTGSFTLRQIKAATNNFDYANKIGEGGFGSVYKGQLSDGTVIAVKQLSSKSRQGNREFGLTFLHEESRIMIVHRDIKATNVLLDENLNAKISDFGLAKLNEGENTHISTRIAGTIGYMAPEYALWGYLTDKADVYSFGVVTLEIVSGKNNSNYTPDTTCTCLLDWAFVLKQKGSLMELVDPNLGTEFNKKEAETMIKVALLCTNASSKLRPTMSAVLRMLEGQDIIPEVISDPSIYGKDMRISPLRDHYQHMEMQSSSGSLAPNFSLDGAQVGSSSSA